jgi:cell division transport system permease protein
MRRKLITLRRIITTGLKNFFRNSWLSVAATAVMIVALTIILATVVLNVTAKNAIAELSKNIKISVYLKDDAKNSDVNLLRLNIDNNPYVADVVYVSKDDAQKNFSESYKEDKKLLEGLALVGGNSLPASLEISVNNMAKIEEVGKIAQEGKYASFVDSVSLGKTDAKKTIDRAASMQSYITTASLIAAIIFAVVSMLIIFNTIRMAIYTRSEEIKIMKLIGATPGYIRGPFIIEASFYGVLAGIAAASIVFGLVYSLGSKVSSQAEFSATYTFFMQPRVIAAMYLGAVLLGVLVGIISSALAMEKHLKLKHW